MTPEALEALKGSIKKWEDIVASKDKDLGGENCPLCRLFADHERPLEEWCEGCPVKEKTGLPSCDGTPYYQVKLFNENPPFTDKQVAAAQTELDFLRSLLPRWEWGFDTTKFSADGWGCLRNDIPFRFHRRVADHLNEFEWRSIAPGGEFDDRFMVWTTNNPHTGQYYQPQQRGDQLDFAGYIGIEGNPKDVARLVEGIKKYAEYIKDETPYQRSFI